MSHMHPSTILSSMPLLSASLPKGHTELHWHWCKLSNINTISRDNGLTFFIYNEWSLWLVRDGLHILILKNKCWRWSENVATPHLKKNKRCTWFMGCIFGTELDRQCGGERSWQNALLQSIWAHPCKKPLIPLVEGGARGGRLQAEQHKHSNNATNANECADVPVEGSARWHKSVSQNSNNPNWCGQLDGNMALMFSWHLSHTLHVCHDLFTECFHCTFVAFCLNPNLGQVLE